MEIPNFLTHLPMFSGFPVFYTVMWNGNKPDFRVVDHSKVERCVHNQLCGICGNRMFEWGYFIGGPNSRESLLFKDPAMHLLCAEFSTKICPYLTGQRVEYSERLAVISGVIVQRSELMEAKRPKEMFILRARLRNVKPEWLGREFAINSGPLFGAKRIPDVKGYSENQ